MVRNLVTQRPSYLFVLGMLMLSGCGASDGPKMKAVYPVTGTIFFKGEPIPDATVSLHPVGISPDSKEHVISRGRVNFSGDFQLSTYETGDGAPSGDYLVAVSWSGPLEGLSEEEQDVLKELLPQKYTNPETSGLKATVVAGENSLPKLEID